MQRIQNGAQMPHLGVILGDRYVSSNVTDGHDFHLKLLVIIVTKRENLAQIYPTQNHPSRTVPNSSTYKFWATLSNSPDPGRINKLNASGMPSERVDQYLTRL